jgi:hypothetical protein
MIDVAAAILLEDLAEILEHAEHEHIEPKKILTPKVRWNTLCQVGYSASYGSDPVEQTKADEQ